MHWTLVCIAEACGYITEELAQSTPFLVQHETWWQRESTAFSSNVTWNVECRHPFTQYDRLHGSSMYDWNCPLTVTISKMFEQFSYTEQNDCNCCVLLTQTRSINWWEPGNMLASHLAWTCRWGEQTQHHKSSSKMRSKTLKLSTAIRLVITSWPNE